jgi:glyoxylase-like metal-dependent hydrolase (beta-lactamase superfamily II)
MIFRQLISNNGGCITYILGCTQAGELIIIDPKIDLINEIIKFSKEYDMKIEYIIETHTHADHISGAKKLAREANGRVFVHENSLVKYNAEKLKDSEELKVGNVVIKIIHTPGHTPDIMSLLLTDLKRSTEPWAVFTGDTLFVGGIGRVDIGGEESIENLFYSLQKLKNLPDYVEIYPTHTSGSPCGYGISGKPSSTIGFEKKYNNLFKIDNKEDFIKILSNIKFPELKGFNEIIRKNIEND